ncbi:MULTISPECIES: hypothetical protein [Paenibacillus]|uniref:hypothetical protein n=1 Tax=Paenibacillus TaxID=44249 RepID=UPI00096E2E96|nr:hypothetical protein [Paenibacillus odorifer]MEC0132823.1 hypothetical protein [Paenibacillus odorifer]MEC0224426.1 hypothetical protein [Paenibacillus odorifer]OMD01293.1 hypothetical protein BJP46_00825 [Paenibacillus odorifer]
MIRHALIFWISVIFAIFGFVIGVLTEPFYTLSKLILPLVLLAIIYYAYKMGPGKYARSSNGSRIKVKPSQKTMTKVAGIRKTQAAPGKRKSYPFQVIEGNKGKNDDQLPKYH